MKNLIPGLLVALTIGAFVAACGSEVVDASAGAASASSSTGAESSLSSTGTMGEVWPKRITLVSSLGADQSDGVQLVAGVMAAGDGDLSLYTGKMLSVTSPVPESVCAKGKFDALGDVPTDLDSCPADLSGTWQHFAYLSATTLHTTEDSMVAGLGLLLWNEEHTALYRARVVGDSYDAQAMSTVTIDYEPVP
jgi:hypothetical protein